MNLIWAISLTTPARIIKRLSHAVVLGQTASTVHLHGAIDHVLDQERYGCLGRSNHIDRSWHALLINFMASL